MKNKILLIGLLPFTLSMTAESTYKATLGSSAYKDSVEVLEYINDDSEVVTPPTPSLPSSCKDIFDSGDHTGNGVYTITNSSEYEAYCDMTTDGGGWTLVTAQFETDPVTNWNEGVQSDYDPTLVSSKSFTLSTAEIPSHTQTSFGGATTSNVNISSARADLTFNYIYTTGNISLQTIISTTGISHQIHRNQSNFYRWHDPEEEFYTTLPVWFDTLALDRVGGKYYSYAFSPNQSSRMNRGYGLLNDLQYAEQSYAWAVWVR